MMSTVEFLEVLNADAPMLQLDLISVNTKLLILIGSRLPSLWAGPLDTTVVPKYMYLAAAGYDIGDKQRAKVGSFTSLSINLNGTRSTVLMLPSHIIIIVPYHLLAQVSYISQWV